MKTVILVAGVDYEFKPNKRPTNFRQLCENRMKRILIRNAAKEDIVFKLFDFQKGEVITSEVTYPGGKKTEKNSKISPSPFKPITKSNYEAVTIDGETYYRFKDGQRGTLSIIDIYRTIQEIGIDSPGTLVELSFFSHAFWGGPILVNSYEDSTHTLSGARDPDDMDPRSSKDFSVPTMDDVALSKFQKAFHSDGYSWIWGCNFPRLVHEILSKIERNPAYKDSGVDDSKVFRIKDFDNKQADYLGTVLWQGAHLLLPDNRSIEIEFKYLKYFFRYVTAATYAHNLARNSKVRAYGGVIGTYSGYDTGALPLMSVDKKFVKHFAFYKSYLAFDFDPEGRKYGEYKPDFTCTAPSP